MSPVVRIVQVVGGLGPDERSKFLSATLPISSQCNNVAALPLIRREQLT